MGQVKEPRHQTVTRRSDEPKLEIGEVVQIKQGVGGVVVARYTVSGDESQDLHYIVEFWADRVHQA